MKLNDNHIFEFQTLYKKHFGQKLSKEEALEKALRLIRLVEIVSHSAAAELSETKSVQKRPRRVP